MRVVLLLSGGIDSPVSGYLALSKGFELICVHMQNSPNADSSKIEGIVSLLEETTDSKIKTFLIPHYPAQEQFHKSCDNKFQCVLCKRMMLRIAGKIAEKENAGAIITGDSLGQVASQTIENLLVESQATETPIIRPLIGFDKEETILISKKIGTYELSIRDAGPCPFVPKKVSTSARLDKIKLEEGKINVDSLIEDCLKNAKQL
ncbi:MAG: hypothetical protein ABH851_05430 [Methanobacteriota archaeon]